VLHQAMRGIKTALLQEVSYPNKTLIAVCIEGTNVEPFVGAMNINLTEAPQTLAWHTTLYQRMFEYLNNHSITKFEIGLCIGTDAGDGLANFGVCGSHLAIGNNGDFGIFSSTVWKRVSLDRFSRFLSVRYPIFRVISDRMEGIFGENSIPQVFLLNDYS
jgi:hypothetical protein